MIEVSKDALTPKAAKAQERRVKQTVAALLVTGDIRKVFFANLILRLEFISTASVQTMCTDGKRVWYNPSFVATMNDYQLEFVICHELMHGTNDHEGRRAGRDPRTWNEATDLAINSVLAESGFGEHDGIPEGAYLPDGDDFPFPKLLSAEEYYSKLVAAREQERPPLPTPSPTPSDSGGEDSDGEGAGDSPSDCAGDEPSDQPGGGGDPSEGDEGDAPVAAQNAVDPGGCGTFIECEDAEEAKALRQDTEMAVRQAAHLAEQMSRQAGGDIPEVIRGLVDELNRETKDWRSLLQEYALEKTKDDYTWSRPNRRGLGAGMILPGLYSESLGLVAVSIDTSGSIQEEEVASFLSEIEAILSAYDCSLKVLFHTHRVYKVLEWEPADGTIQFGDLQSGGTSHREVFEKLEEDDPSVFIGFTDGYSSFPDAPDYPVIWALTEQHTEPPFGDISVLD